MKFLLSAALLHALIGPASETRGSAPVSAPAIADDPAEQVHADVVKAEAAWRGGAYVEVRRLLEPHVEAGIEDAKDRVAALTYLADATVADRSLDTAQRDELAQRYLKILLQEDPDWQLPPATYSPELYQVYRNVRADWATKAVAQCEANLTVCNSDSEKHISSLEEANLDLRTRLQDQPVLVRDKEIRSRVFAAIPLGLGHIYNGDRSLGWAFLSLEAAVGITGLALMLTRVTRFQCRRADGFQRGSLLCGDGNESYAERTRLRRNVVKMRKAEEAFGWLFLGSAVLDVVLAQIRFRPVTIRTREVPRSELDESLSSQPRQRKPRKRRPRATVRPSSAVSRSGAGLGIIFEF